MPDETPVPFADVCREVADREANVATQMCGDDEEAALCRHHAAALRALAALLEEAVDIDRRMAGPGQDLARWIVAQLARGYVPPTREET